MILSHIKGGLLHDLNSSFRDTWEKPLYPSGSQSWIINWWRRCVHLLEQLPAALLYNYHHLKDSRIFWNRLSYSWKKNQEWRNTFILLMTLYMVFTMLAGTIQISFPVWVRNWILIFLFETSSIDGPDGAPLWL